MFVYITKHCFIAEQTLNISQAKHFHAIFTSHKAHLVPNMYFEFLRRHVIKPSSKSQLSANYSPKFASLLSEITNGEKLGGVFE